jgi:hypothetical protein
MPPRDAGMQRTRLADGFCQYLWLWRLIEDVGHESVFVIR